MQKEATRISEVAFEKVLGEIREGMTELEIVRIIQQVIYSEGAEYEGLPQYVFFWGEDKTCNI